ncbi:Hypothetical predicted protein [Cloeon dipterum]|uniref:PSI domain-containing protein n=1 Tax=Cloeon dipterum TaxID=197152 RepID=A0A8S1D4V9_9INSE|nr:Hypothetical predicted protein [Cloeon dipterum]
MFYASIYIILLAISYISSEEVSRSRSTEIFDGEAKAMVSHPLERDHWFVTSAHKIDNFGVEYSWANFKNVEAVELDEDVIYGSRTRNFKRVKLLFDFPFYGMSIRDVLIMEEGFISFGHSPEEWKEDTQFVAPFMAQFDPIHGTMSTVKYINSGLSLTVQWNNMKLKIFDKTRGTHTIIEEKFSFEATLTKAGAIIFKYKELPSQSVLKLIKNHCYVGINHKNFRIDSKGHPININLDFYFKISNGSNIVLMPKTGCSSNKVCKTCVSLNNYSTNKYFCGWCPRLQKCSDGLDTNKPEWDEMVKDIDSCPDENTEKTEESDSSWLDWFFTFVWL